MSNDPRPPISPNHALETKPPICPHCKASPLSNPTASAPAYEYEHAPTCPRYVDEDSIPVADSYYPLDELLSDAVLEGSLDMDTAAEAIRKAKQ